METTDKFLATKWKGLALPVFGIGGDYFRSSGSFEVIWSSILMILMTPRGLRLYDPTFGSRLLELVFEPNDGALITLATHYVTDAIESSGEDRVIVREVNVSVSEENMSIMIVLDYYGEVYEGNLTLRRNTAFDIVMQGIRRVA